MTTFDPLRREELRIMGYGDLVDTEPNTEEKMGKLIVHDGPLDVTAGRVEALADDIIIEYASGATEHMTAAELKDTGWLLLPPEANVVDAATPVQLAEPVGLLQRDESAETEEPHDA